uniref:Anaphase-promoting complex subunit 10 n=1 Tax=Rhizophora mucronata TaxID=61149 RepID=A0A2P2K031_RHIMU
MSHSVSEVCDHMFTNMFARETFVNTFMLQIAVLSNYLNGRDTHIRQIKVYGPQLNPIPHQPFKFTSTEFITYSTVR